jgi:hypothetical protein
MVVCIKQALQVLTCDMNSKIISSGGENLHTLRDESKES